MAWSTPVTPVSGTVITVAWATSAVVDPVNWLRRLTGNADPPGAGHVALSTSTTLAGWFDLTTALAAKLSDAGDTMTGDLQVNRSSVAAPTTGFLILGNDTAKYIGYDGAKHVVVTPRMDVQNDLFVYRASATTTGYTVYGAPGTHFVGFDGTNIVADASRVHTDANTVGVPLGAVVWFRTLAEVTSAGASWTRETNLDGRLPIGAGTTFSQTFAEATNYGANWTPSSGLTISAIAVTADAPFLVNVGTNTNVTTSTHTHPAPTLNGSGTAWLPPARAGIFARRI
jgi:hypothetical protein